MNASARENTSKFYEKLLVWIFKRTVIISSSTYCVDVNEIEKWNEDVFEDWSKCDLSSESDSVIDEVVTKIYTAKVQMVSREWHFYSKSTRSSQRYCYDRLKKLSRKKTMTDNILYKD